MGGEGQNLTGNTVNTNGMGEVGAVLPDCARFPAQSGNLLVGGGFVAL